jgi:hypothetical protein
MTPTDRSSTRELERRAKDLEDVADDILDFFKWSYGGEEAEADTLLAETTEEKLARIATLIDEVLPAMSTMATGGVLNAEVFLQARRDLAETKALARAIRD